MCIGAIDLVAGEFYEPGDVFEKLITMIVWPELKEKLHIGYEWRICEGPQVVGTGLILDLVDI